MGVDRPRRGPGRTPPSSRATRPTTTASCTVAPVVLFLALVLLLGLYIPPPLRRAPARGRRVPGGEADERPALRRRCERDAAVPREQVPLPAARRLPARSSSTPWPAGRRVAALFGDAADGDGRRSSCTPSSPTSAEALLRGRPDAAVDRTVPLADPGLPAGPPVRAGDRRAVRGAPGGAPLAQAGPVPPVLPPRPRRLGPGAENAGHRRHGLLPGRGRGGPRGGGRPGPRRASSSRGTSASSATARRCSTWRSRSATSTAGSSGRWSAGRQAHHPL